MGKQSQAWKALERQAADALDGVRVQRGSDFSVSDVDVILAGLPGLRVDCKYRTAHAHHTLLEEIRKKYCKGEQAPVLVTKHHGQRGACVTVDLETFARLLSAFRAQNDGTFWVEMGGREE